MTRPDRYHALDAVRGFALLAGIVLHATMSFFLPIPVADSSQSTTLAVLFFVIHTFRMTLFFVMAGFFARLLLERRGVAGFLTNRATRILVPMIIGWLILLPLITAVMFWSGTRQLSPDTAAAVWATLPSAIIPHAISAVPLTHLWFLYYLCIFYVLALGTRWLFQSLDRSGRAAGLLDRCLGVLLGGYLSPPVLALPLFAVLGFDDRMLMSLGIPTPDAGLVPQVPALVGFGMAFLVGWFVHRQTSLLQQLRAHWAGHLAVAAALTVLCLTVLHVNPGAATGWLLGSAVWSRAVYVACYLASVWYWSLGITGAALRFCSGESAVRRYVADSSYWLYLAHLPLVFFLQVLFAPLPWQWAIKFPLIVGTALAVLLLSYHYLVRPTFIGELLNGRRYPRRRELQRRAAVAEAVAVNAAVCPVTAGAPAPSSAATAAGVPGLPAPAVVTVAAAMAAVNDAAANDPSAAEPLAELRGVYKRYGKLTALDGLDLTVNRGELLALLGPNGAGKSTAISLCLGLTQPDAGEARLFGRSPLEIDARRDIGVMMQDALLAPELRVRELIELTTSYYPHPMSVREVIELTGTQGIAERRYGKLSGGQKRQAQFALAVCGQPRLLFLDEPTAGLDVQARETMWRTIRALLELGSSIVLTTHYLEEAEALADRVAVLNHGQLIACGSVGEIRSIVSRREISCSTTVTESVARAWPEVLKASRDARRLHLTAADAESVVRRLLATDPGLRELEVRQAGLAEAFAVLTKEAA